MTSTNPDNGQRMAIIDLVDAFADVLEALDCTPEPLRDDAIKQALTACARWKQRAREQTIQH